MIIEINAFDTLFFRDSKPFYAGEETWAESIFPPYPSTIYGALRSIYFSHYIDELEKTNSEDDPTKDLKINGIYLKIGDDFYLPLPLDCARDKEKNENKKNKVFMLNLTKTENFIGKIDLPYYLTSDKKIENIPDGLVRISAFENYLYLNLSKKEFSIQKISNFTKLEPKIGITRSNSTLTSEIGKLYRIDMKRQSNKKGDILSIVVDFEGLDIPKNGILKLGGEGKAADYKIISNDLNINSPEFNADDKYFKVVLSTPAIFDNGWIPEWIDKESFEGNINGLKIKLITAVIGKPLIIGGFDIKKRKPKPAYKAVPAGSVYYFEILNGEIETVIELFHKKSISDKYQNEGYGISFVGKFNL